MAVNGVRGFQKAVTTAGTRVQLEATDAKPACKIIIKAATTNTGAIYVGDAAVSSTVGYLMAPSDVITLTGVTEAESGAMYSLNNIWIDAETSGNKVFVLCDTIV